MAAFAVSVMPIAKYDEWREFAQEIESGRYADDHRAFLRRIGVTRENVFAQRTPMGDVLVLVWDGISQDEAQRALQSELMNPQSDYERHLVNYVVRELHGIDPTAGPPPTVEHVATIES
jgi:hypothetical protein